MSHEVESMMYVGATPWHGLGEFCGDEPLTSEEAIIKAGLDWEVSKVPLWACHESEEDMSPIHTHMAIRRDTDHEVLGVVGTRYQPVQNREAFQFMDALVEAGEMKYHTAGSLRNGQRIFLLGKIGSSEVVPNDKVDHFLFLYNTHDGSGALRCLFTQVRVVCANTARLALSAGKKEGVYLKHTANIKDRLEEARKILGIARNEFDAFDEFMKSMSSIGMNAEMVDTYLNSLIPDNEEAERNTRTENQRGELLNLFENGVGMDIKGVGGTMWGAYSATVEYVNFHRGTRSDNGQAQAKRFESSMFGSGNGMIQKSVEILSDMASA